MTRWSLAGLCFPPSLHWVLRGEEQEGRDEKKKGRRGVRRWEEPRFSGELLPSWGSHPSGPFPQSLLPPPQFPPPELPVRARSLSQIDDRTVGIQRWGPTCSTAPWWATFIIRISLHLLAWCDGPRKSQFITHSVYLHSSGPCYTYLGTDVLTCHSRRSTGVTNNINDGSVPLKCLRKLRDNTRAP